MVPSRLLPDDLAGPLGVPARRQGRGERAVDGAQKETRRLFKKTPAQEMVLGRRRGADGLHAVPRSHTDADLAGPLGLLRVDRKGDF